MLSKTKLDSSSPQAQFCIEGYSRPYRLGRDQNGGGIMSFVSEIVLFKLSKAKFNSGNK